jgi:hypothetical protein
MAVYTVTFRLKDSESDVRYAPFPLYLGTAGALADYTAQAQAFAAKLDAVTESQLVGIDLGVAIALPGGLKATPDTGAYNERGGLIGWDTSGQFSDSVRIPAILHTIMSGDSFALDDADILALTDQMQLAVNGLTPVTRDGFDWVAPTYAKKSARRK